MTRIIAVLCILLVATSCWGQDDSGWEWYADWTPIGRVSTPLSDSAILCQPYFDLDIPDDIKNSVMWMFCDSIVYAVSANLNSAISTDIVYYTWFGTMTYYEYRTNECPDNWPGCIVSHPMRTVYGLRDYPQPFATIWRRRVLWKTT